MHDLHSDMCRERLYKNIQKEKISYFYSETNYSKLKPVPSYV